MAFNVDNRSIKTKRYPHVWWSVLSLLIVLAGLALSCRPVSREPLNVLLIVVDTLRADRLGCYGWKPKTSPNIDKLAGDGVRFEKMICQVPQTLPSFCSILTGLYPRTHGVRVNGLFSLSPDAVTMAEMWRQSGYVTAAFVAGFPLDARFGIDQGFDTYSDEMRTRRPMKGVHQNKDGRFQWIGHATLNFENTADIVTTQALNWLGEHGKSPFFLMLHYFDPHHDYLPPAPFNARFEHPYEGEVAFTDDQIGRVINWLNENELREKTLVVFTADHGECLGEHGRYYHQGQLVEAALNVPFILSLPNRLPADKNVSGYCESIDIFPTLLDITGLKKPDHLQGQSLLPAIRNGSVAARPLFFDSLYNKLELKNGITREGVLHEKWKFIDNHREDPKTGERSHQFELYNLGADPEELTNLAAISPLKAENMRKVLDRFKSDHPENQAPQITPDSESLQKLKSLGYLE